MKKTTKGFLAGVAGFGLLLGGTTFALWNDSAPMSGAEITAGNLEVKVNDASWKDISSDRRDSRRGGHDIDLGSFRIIPGDTIQAKYPVKVGLEGDNMVAQLRLAESGKNATGELTEGLDISYEIQDTRGKTVATAGWRGATVTLASKDNSNRGDLITVGADARGKAEFNVIVTVTFKDQDARNLTKAQAVLADAELELKQVRKGVHGYR